MDEYEIIDRLATLEAGWASVADIAFTAEPDSPLSRGRVRDVVRGLARRGDIDSLYVRHRSEPLLCVRLDPDQLRRLAVKATVA